MKNLTTAISALALGVGHEEDEASTADFPSMRFDDNYAQLALALAAVPDELIVRLIDAVVHT